MTRTLETAASTSLAPARTVAIETFTPEPGVCLALGFASCCCVFDYDAAAWAGAAGVVESIALSLCVKDSLVVAGKTGVSVRAAAL